jgi:8-oxo-dGTP pyrophosphatase MutT (NUDIX family)
MFFWFASSLCQEWACYFSRQMSGIPRSICRNLTTFLYMPYRRIYFADKPFIITDTLQPDEEALAAKHGTIMLNHYDRASLLQATYSLENTPAQAVIVLTAQPAEAFHLFQSFFTPVQTGGGLIKNEKEEYLFIFRRKRWDLPKGKLDEGETIEQCALREVEEETGLKKVTLGEHLTDTWHAYYDRGQRILKQGIWFRMTGPSKQKLVPQIEEDIEEITWLLKAQWPAVLKNTFPSIKDVLAAEGM